MSDFPSPPFATNEAAAPAVSWFTKLLRAVQARSIKGLKVTGGTGKIIEGPDGRTLMIDIPKPGAASRPGFYPFKVYQPTNFKSFATGITFLGNDGAATVCNIDATKPTDFGAVPPTVNPDTDAWRFWAVRAGECEVRPLYTNLWNTADAVSDNGGVLKDPYNSGWKYSNIQYTDFVQPDGNLFHPANYDDATLETVSPPLIIAGELDPYNPEFGLYGGIWWAVWLQIIPDTAPGELPQIRLAARTWRNHSTADGGFPDRSQNAIPVGVLFPIFTGDLGMGTGRYSTNFVVDQKLFDHVRNRFEPGAGNFGAGGLMNFRGTWDGDEDVFDPADLGGQIFYANDVVIVTKGGFVGQYMFKGIQYSTWVDPTTTAVWKLMWITNVALVP